MVRLVIEPTNNNPTTIDPNRPIVNSSASCDNPTSVPSIANGSTINQNYSNYVMSIASRETGFSGSEASTDRYNQVSNNSNVPNGVNNGMSVSDAQAKYGDYGFFQTNQADVDDAVRHGVDPSVASAMNNGGGNGNYSLDQQANATAEYIRVRYPAAYDAASRGDYDTANSMLKGKWPSLPGGRSHRAGNDACANAILAGNSTGGNGA